MKYRLVFYLLLITLLSTHKAQDKTLDEIVVSAGRTPISFLNLGRSVTVLTLDEIKSIPVNNIVDLLKYATGVDLRSRGTEGIQSDISIRGGSFEQTLVLIDGVKLSDPQTSHHNLNLPISLNNVERIEILKGHGSRIFGANAMSGVVNIITKKNQLSNENISLLGGEYGLFGINLSASIPIYSFSNTFSFEKKISDGYTYNTGFKTLNASLNQSFSFGENLLKTFIGYIDKDFGANKFYSDLFPNQAERTITRLANISSELKFPSFTLSPKIFLRNNFDDYHLDFSRPDWNHNTHRTQSYGGEVQSSFISEFGVTSLGGEWGKDEITSSNLGVHSRTKAGIFAEQQFQLMNKLNISTGFFAYHYSEIGWKIWPGFDLSYNPNDEMKIFFSYGQAFRIPTFTELYYVSPANMGNVNLVHEQTNNYETGISFSKSSLNFESSIFFKDGINLIDWVRLRKEDPWRVENISNVKTIGAELSIEISLRKMLARFPIEKINFNYTYLSSDRKTGGYQSKYLLDHLRHQLLINFVNELPFDFKQTWFARLEQRENSETHFIIDSQISKSLGNFSFFIRSTNLFNQSYFDIPGVPLPGRWLSAGIGYSYR